MTEKHRELIGEWQDAYYEYRKLLPAAVNLGAPDADELLRAAAQADWAAMDRAWERVHAAHSALMEYRQGADDDGGSEPLAEWR